jgi:hypothetical protein
MTRGWDTKPKSLHIGAYLDGQSKASVLRYLRETKLTGGVIKSVNIHHMHVSLLYHGSLILPPDFPREKKIAEPIDLSGVKWPVKTLPLHGTNKIGTPIAIWLPRVPRFQRLSNLLHAKFKLTPVPPTYIWHITISDIQTFPRNSREYSISPFKSISDYLHLPPYTGRLVFDRLMVSYNGD